jgi:hypothetical protein
MQLILDYPTWFILFCLLLGALAAFALYYKTRHFTDESDNFKLFKAGMALFRFVSVSVITFLLLSPFIKSKFIEKIAPVVVFVHDDSESVQITFHSVDSSTYISQTNQMLNRLSEKFDVDYYTFSSSLSASDTLTFTGKTTHLSNALSELNSIYHNRNVGAVILATDGIYNEGINPVYTDFNFPIYTIALGDTLPQQDLKISAVRNNKIAYLDDKVMVEIDVEAHKLKGEKFKLEVNRIEAGKKVPVAEETFSINKEYEEFSTSITVNASRAGMLRFKAEVTRLKDEITHDNNEREFYIDVIDSRQKILIVANAPHPDIAAIRQVINLNKNYEAEVQYAAEFNANLDKYNLVILHQLPSLNIRANQIFTAVKKSKTPYWIITGASTQYTHFNQEQNIINVQQSGNSTNDAGAYINNNFKLFTLDENISLKMKRFPPVQVPFGNYEFKTGVNTLIYQRIGAVETDFPILSFADQMGVKSAVYIGDGLWRWRMYDYLDNKNHDIFNEIVQKTINYLAVKADKRRFKVNLPKNIFSESEQIIMEAELYNESYELINTPEVNIVITDEEANEYPFVFGKVNSAYSLKTNALPVGNYTYKAITILGGKNYNAEGSFSVIAVQIEALQTTANHQLLQQLSEKTNGKMFFPNELNELELWILNQPDIKPVLYENFKTRSILNLYWIFFLIVAILSAEWFARKYFGGY